MGKKRKTIIGHSHVPAITKGVYAVGTSMCHGYNYTGPAKWLDFSQLESRIILATCSLDCTCDADRNRRREAVMATRAKYGR